MTKLAALYLEQSAANAQLATGFSSHLGREEPERKKLKRRLPYLGSLREKAAKKTFIVDEWNRLLAVMLLHNIFVHTREIYEALDYVANMFHLGTHPPSMHEPMSA